MCTIGKPHLERFVSDLSSRGDLRRARWLPHSGVGQYATINQSNSNGFLEYARELWKQIFNQKVIGNKCSKSESNLKQIHKFNKSIN